MIFRRICIIAKSVYYLHCVSLSTCTKVAPTEHISVTYGVGIFVTICRGDPMVEIGQKYQALHEDPICFMLLAATYVAQQ